MITEKGISRVCLLVPFITLVMYWFDSKSSEMAVVIANLIVLYIGVILSIVVANTEAHERERDR